MIITLSGQKGSGKDYVCQRLEEIVVGREVERVAFADKVKDSIASLFDIAVDEWERNKDSEKAKITFTKEDGEEVSFTPREFMQHYATRAHHPHFGEEVWANLVDEKFAEHHGRLLVVTDLRFPHELTYLRTHHRVAYRVKVVSPNDVPTPDHPSESVWSAGDFDYTLRNNHSGPARVDEQLREICGRIGVDTK